MRATFLAVGLLFVASSPVLAEDAGWPRVHQVGQDQLTVFQPQIDSWDAYQTLHFRAAIAVTPAGRKDPVYGLVVASATTVVEWETRGVFIWKPKYEEIRFPAASPEDTALCLAIAKQVADPNKTWELSLDRVIAGLEQTKEQQRQVEVNLDPPPIFYADHDAILVVFLGPPTFQPIPGSSLLFATNTNWPVVMDPKGGRVYLLDGESWLTAPDATKGPWTAATSLPADLYRLPDDPNWAKVKTHVPGYLPAKMPTVFVSDRPAELIVTKGDPQLVMVPGTSLFYVANTSSDLFLDVANGTYYFLAAGRWFSAPGFAGPWTAATKTLPADFAKIPIDSPRADVLASVPGTPQAQEAVLMASIPKTAKVDRSKATIVVTYQGDPKFKPVDGTTGVSVAENSTDVVFQVGAGFYCCRDGVWFQAAQPVGPWTVCTQVPPAIYTIPVTSPYHNVTYVVVYDSSPTTVTTGYTSGYTGAYVAAGLLMFGAGYWAANQAAYWATPYAAWHYAPSYYAYGTASHYSYYDGAYVRGSAYYGPYGGAGYEARYNPSTGTYARGAGVYGPYAGAGTVAAYNPATGATARGAAAYGPYGAVGAAGGYNPTTGNAAGTYQRSNAYGSWGTSAVSSGNQWAQTAHSSTAWGSTGAWNTSSGASGAVHSGATGNTGVAQTANGNVYAGHDGNVYKYDPSSGWSKNTGSGWESSSAQKPTTSAQAPKTSQPPASASGGGAAAETQRSLDSAAANRNYSNYRSSGSEGGERSGSWGGERSGGSWGGERSGGWGGGGRSYGGGGRRR